MSNDQWLDELFFEVNECLITQCRIHQPLFHKRVL